MILRVFIAFVAVFMSLAVANAQGHYLIKPGDTLRVEILEDDSLNRQILVLPDGNVSFPMAGTIRAGGLTTEQVERAIASRVSSNFAVTPTIFVSVYSTAVGEAEIAAPDAAGLVVYLMGEVNEPGPKEVVPGTTFLQVLSQSGGFTKFAATKRLQLRRKEVTGQRLFKVNYKAISEGAMVTTDPVLRAGDVILVPERRLFE